MKRTVEVNGFRVWGYEKSLRVDGKLLYLNADEKEFTKQFVDIVNHITKKELARRLKDIL